MASKEVKGKEKIKEKENLKFKRRMLIIFSMLFLLFFGLTIRLSYIMIHQSSKLKTDAVEQRKNEVTIAAKRGSILDRNGKVLALSADVYRVDLDLNTIRNEIKLGNKNLTNDGMTAELGKVAQKLADATGMKYEDVNKIVTKTLKNGIAPGSANLARKIEKQQADKVSALKINGVMVSEDTKRYYPSNNFLSHVLGFTTDDDKQQAANGLKGLYGVEATYDKQLSGLPGKRITEYDSKNLDELPFASSSYTKPVDGKDVVLTIDVGVQQLAEEVAEQALKDYKAKAISIVITDPRNGEILAMVNKPDYNPNDKLNDNWKNRAVMDIFEPGSIFKVITAAAAMQEGVVKSTDTFECDGGLYVGRDFIHCDAHHGHEDFAQIIEKSCNVGFMQLGQRLGKERLNNYVNLFGFGQKTGVDLTGEATGIAKKTKDLSNTDLATLSFGQVDSISCIQYIAAFNAVANGGKWIRPHVMKQVQHYDSNNKKIVDETYNNFGTKQIINPAIAKELRGYLENVVTEGTAMDTFIEGYHIAGKTGTAQKAINGGYPEGKYVASFAGMAPADNPRFTVLVSLDEPDPSNHFAAQTAVPISKQIFTGLFSNNLDLVQDGSIESVRKDVVIPDLRGSNKQDAMKTLKDMHLNFDIDNNGDVISNISPMPGNTLKEGEKVSLITGSAAVNSKIVNMPKLSGYTSEEAQEVLNSLGLRGSFHGGGRIYQQSISPNEEVNKGILVDFQLMKPED